MKRRRSWLIVGVILAVLLAIVIVVGPWPTVRSERRAVTRPTDRALKAVGSGTAMDARLLDEGSSLLAGWAVEPLLLPEGTPLAGYGDRRGEPSTGYHDPLEVGAVTVGTEGKQGDGPRPLATIVTSDLLIIPAPVADRVRSEVGHPVLFTASHTHSGPGAAMRGLVARAFGGRYDPAVQDAVVTAITAAVIAASGELQPVTISAGSIDAPGFIRNRTRNQTAGYPLIDPAIDLVQFRRRDGELLTLVRYSAHTTVIGASNMEFSAGYPGYLRERLETRFGGQALFVAGAMGSMGPRAPEGADHFARAEALAAGLDAAIGAMEMQPMAPEGEAGQAAGRLALGVVDLALRSPPVQLRIARGLRLSPIFLAMNGVNRNGRMTAIMLGNLLIIGFPGDLSGEIGAKLRAWGTSRGLHVMATSFAGAYQGYISPDAYYDELRENGSLAYETGIMSWMGPGQERFFVSTAHAVAEALASPQP